MKKTIFIILILVCVGAIYLLGAYYLPKLVSAPEEAVPSVSGFRGPTGEPSVRGPASPSPGQ